jgi:hypothetical protein
MSQITRRSLTLPLRNTEHVLTLGALGLLAAFALYALLRTASWPLIHDVPLLHFIATRMLAGDLPYRDHFDMNLPGTYAVHLLVLSTLGSSDAAWRTFDIGLLLLTSWTLYSYCRPGGVALAVWAALIHIPLYLTFGPSNTGQRDAMVVPCMIVGLHLTARSMERTGHGWSLGVAGFLFGLAATVKPYVVVLLAMLVALYILQNWRTPRVAVRGALSLCSSAAIPLGGMLMWLAASGSLASFLDLLVGYLIPFYGGLMRRSPIELLLKLVAFLIASGLGLALCAGLQRGALASHRARLAAAALAYGGIHFLIQGKGWNYHLLPLQAFALMAATCWFSLAVQRGGRPRSLALAVLLIVSGVVGARGLLVVERPTSLATAKPLVGALVDDLQAIGLAPHATVQVLDTTDGGIHALFRLGLRQPTRFIYDFPLLHNEGTPFVQRLRGELIADLQAHRPAAIVIFHNAWLPPHTLGRIDSFPALRNLLHEAYRIGAVRGTDTDGYTLYVILNEAGAAHSPDEGKPAQKAERPEA